MEGRKHFLQLHALSCGPSLEILHFYFELKALQVSHNGSFKSFLNDTEKKHILFHEYISTVSCCGCECNKSLLIGPNKKGGMNKIQFLSLFEEISTLDTIHEKKAGGDNSKIIQYCLCKYTAKPSVEICSLDITLMCVILKQCFTPGSIPGYPNWLNDIKDIRNYIVHNGSGEIDECEFLVKWKTLEDAILGYAGTIGECMEKMYRREIYKLKEKSKSDLENVIQKYFDKFVQEVNTKQCLTANTIEDCVKVSETKIEKSLEVKTTELKNHFTAEQFMLADTLAEQNNNLHQKLHMVAKKQDNVLECTGGVKVQVEEILATVRILQTRQKYTSENDCKDKKFLDVECQTETDVMDEDSAVNNLPGKGNESWKIISAEKECVLLHVKMNTAVFKDEDSLRMAIRSLVEEIIRSGKVNTSIPTRMTIQMAIQSSLSEDEIRVIRNITSGIDDESTKDEDNLVSSVGGEQHDDEHNEGQDVIPKLIGKTDKKSENESLLKETKEEEHVDRLLIKGGTNERFQSVESEIEIEFRRQSNTFSDGSNQLLFEERSLRYEIKITSNFPTWKTRVLFHPVPFTVPDRDMIQLHSANTNSIFLEATSSPSIFDTKETLRTAIRLLIKRVLDAGTVDINMAANIHVELKIITPLTDEEEHIVMEMIEKRVDEVQAAGLKIRYQKEQEDMEQNIEPPGNKGIDVDTFGGKQSNSFTGVCESFKSKGEPYVTNAISVFVIEETEVDCLHFGSIPKRLYREEKSLHKRVPYSEIDSSIPRAKTNTENEITTDFDNIAKRFAEFQGFKVYKKLSWMDFVIDMADRFKEFDMGCTVLLIHQKARISAWDLCVKLKSPLFRSESTVVIMQLEEEELFKCMLIPVLRKPDFLLAVFPAQDIGLAIRLLGAAMDKMKIGDDFASVLRAVSKEVEYVAKMTSRPHRLPSVVISTLTKDLCFQKKVTNLPKA